MYILLCFYSYINILGKNMSQRSINQEEVNFELMELNKKYIPKYDVILNTSPPRVGKTINTIQYHIDNRIPSLVFVDNKEQAEDIITDLGNINEKYLSSIRHWKSKEKLCHILQNKEDMIKKHGKEFFKTREFKHNKHINICKNCKYKENCEWTWQKETIVGYNVVLMNKKNIPTPLINNRIIKGYVNIFHNHDLEKALDESIPYNIFDEEPRTIIYDEKLEELHITEFEKLDNVEFKLLNKIISIEKPSANIFILDDDDFINAMEIIKAIFKNDYYIDKVLKELDFDFNQMGKYEKGVYIKIFLRKIRTNIKIYDYLKNRYTGLPKIGGKYDLRFFKQERLYIDILFERNELFGKNREHKIIFLDATPLPSVVRTIKRPGFHEIKLKTEIFNKDSSLLRIYRKKNPSRASRDTIKKRIIKKKIKNNIFQDEAYRLPFKTKKHIDEYKKLNKRKFGFITYRELKINNEDEEITFEPLKEIEKTLKNVHTLYNGNVRGRAELNDCDILYVLGTHRLPSSAMYSLYRYLGGRKTWQELKPVKKRMYKLEYNDELFNEIINHQIDSEMEQVIFRNMPHMNKRLIILEGHLPKHLKDYFKQVYTLNIKTETEKLIFPILIEEFLKALNYNKEFNFELVKKLAELSFEKNNKKIYTALNKLKKEESRARVIKLINEFRTEPEKYTFEKIHKILKVTRPNLLKEAKMYSFSSFKRLYNGK